MNPGGFGRFELGEESVGGFRSGGHGGDERVNGLLEMKDMGFGLKGANRAALISKIKIEKYRQNKMRPYIR